MTRLKLMLMAAMLAFASFVASPALAQTTIIAVDTDRVYRDSKAGKDVASKLKSIANQIKGEIEGPAKSLENEGKSLEAKRKGKTNEQLNADTAFVNQYKAFQTKVIELANKERTLNQEMALTQQKALIDFNKALSPIVIEVAKERKAQVVIGPGQVSWYDPALDATAAVIAKLDQRTSSMTVTRQRAPAPAATPAKTTTTTTKSK